MGDISKGVANTLYPAQRNIKKKLHSLDEKAVKYITQRIKVTKEGKDYGNIMKQSRDEMNVHLSSCILQSFTLRLSEVQVFIKKHILLIMW
jgi:hypothetical protein